MTDEVKEGALLHTRQSDTAETVGHRLHGTSGVMTYRVLMQTAMGGVVPVDVDAASGDEAAELAHKQMVGGKVMNISPAPPKAHRGDE